MLRAFVLTVLLLLLATDSVKAASNSGFWSAYLHDVGEGLFQYYVDYKTFPRDVFDAKGVRLSSWRAVLRPYVSWHTFPRKYRLDLAWNDPANKDFGEESVRPFDCPYFASPRAGVVKPLGQGTFWGDGQKRTPRDFRRDPGKTIILVGVAEDHAPYWSEPKDLDFDPTNPRRGLGWYQSVGFLRERACYVVLGNAQVRRIPESIDDDTLRRLFAPAGEDPVLAWNWFQAATHTHLGMVIVPTMFICLAGMLGVINAVGRLCWRRPISPGEWLWAILGSQQLVFAIFFMTHYEWELTQWRFREPFTLEFWFYPRLASVGFCCLAIVYWHREWRWLMFFGALLVLLGAAAFDAYRPHQFRECEESLVTMGPPFVLAVFALLSTLSGQGREEFAGPRRLWHGLGTFFVIVPLVWFCIWMIAGVVQPRTWFLRYNIRE